MLSGISIWSLLLILVIVLLLFGTKKLKTLGSDLGEAISGFRRSVSDEGKSPTTNDGAGDGIKQETPTEPASDASAETTQEKPHS